MNDENKNSGEDIDVLQKRLSDTAAQAEENLAGWKRAQADFENYRKRKESESEDWINFGKQAGFVQILPALDSLEQAIVHAPDADDPNLTEKYANWKKGLDAIVKQVDEALKKTGIEKMQVIGKKFDPNMHEAVREVPGEEDGIIAEQYQTGFTLNGNMLRPAQVAITKKKEFDA